MSPASLSLNSVRRLLKFAVVLFAFVSLSASTANAQEVMYTDAWNDDADANLDLPLYGVGVTEEWSGSTPEKVETTLYGHSGETLDYAEGSSYFYAEAWVGHWLPWGPDPPIVWAPENCAVTIHLRFVIDGGHEQIGQSLSQVLPTRYKGRYRYNRELSDGSFEYIRDTTCPGACSAPRKCHAWRREWLKSNGWLVHYSPSNSVCLGVLIPQDSQPACNMPWGANLDFSSGCDVAD